MDIASESGISATRVRPPLLALGILILSGGDKLFEAWVLQSAPAWLVGLTTSI